MADLVPFLRLMDAVEAALQSGEGGRVLEVATNYRDVLSSAISAGAEDSSWLLDLDSGTLEEVADSVAEAHDRLDWQQVLQSTKLALDLLPGDATWKPIVLPPPD